MCVYISANFRLCKRMFTQGRAPDAMPKPLIDLRTIALVEGTTLVLLMGVAAPVKRMFDLPEVSSIIGAVHGLAFIVYVAMLIEFYVAGLIGKWLGLRCFILALIPTGTFWNEPSLRRREAAIEQANNVWEPL